MEQQQLLLVLTHLDETLTKIVAQLDRMTHDMGVLLTINVCVACAGILIGALGIWTLSRQVQSGNQALADSLRDLRRGR
jgi:hypothetical protein